MFFFDMPDEYEAFVDKFRAKRTTDDCYTPRAVYEAVAGWVSERYGADRARFVRPFWPGEDFRARQYEPEEIVVDNPPFSIFAKITRFYAERRIPFFLFGPTLTIFSADTRCCVIPCGVSITYANGAVVNTSFATNLEAEDLRIATRPDLYAAVEQADREARIAKAELPRYDFPDHVVTAAMAYRWARYGIEVEIRRGECAKIHELDEMRAEGRGIFGHGYLLSDDAAARKAEAERLTAERAAAERAAVRRWRLSERERGIIRALGRE